MVRPAWKRRGGYLKVRPARFAPPPSIPASEQDQEFERGKRALTERELENRRLALAKVAVEDLNARSDESI
jgi:hypothetical protein